MTNGSSSVVGVGMQPKARYLKPVDIFSSVGVNGKYTQNERFARYVVIPGSIKSSESRR